MTGLAVMLNDTINPAGAIFSKFAGQTVDANAILVRHTWDGDANLDGVVNADDYFAIDSGFITQSQGYQNGDFNYDGLINADDYFLIDSAFIGQTGLLAATKPEAVAGLFSVSSIPTSSAGIDAATRRKDELAGVFADGEAGVLE